MLTPVLSPAGVGRDYGILFDHTKTLFVIHINQFLIQEHQFRVTQLTLFKDIAKKELPNPFTIPLVKQLLLIRSTCPNYRNCFFSILVIILSIHTDLISFFSLFFKVALTYQLHIELTNF